MATSAHSLRTRLYNIAKDEKLSFQDLIHRYGIEQFLERLSRSRHADRFIFKGGSLLAYLIDSERQTRDADFSVRHTSCEVHDAAKTIDEILSLSSDDGIEWGPAVGEPLNHPEMDYPGVRIKTDFALCGARGALRLDLAIGDIVEPTPTVLERIRYRGAPLVGNDFEVMAYSAETIFAEKLQIAINRAGANTRMKDYYDLLKLIESQLLTDDRLRGAILTTFAKRGTAIARQIDFDAPTRLRLQTHWGHYIRKMKLRRVPSTIDDLIGAINDYLQRVWNGEKTGS